MTIIKQTKLEKHLLETMFENSLYSDLSLEFVHPSFPFSMRFNVHKAIVSQSPFLRERITTEPHLTIDLMASLTERGFTLAPFQHIVRRKWQKTTQGHHQDLDRTKRETLRPLLASHIRSVLTWLYAPDRIPTDNDTLWIISLALLLDLPDLTQPLIQHYCQTQLNLTNLLMDLETICQLPPDTTAYQTLRDATLLLLLRTEEDPDRLGGLPIDYMKDVLGSDLLFVEDEFDRYCLLRSVLEECGRSVGVSRRLSGRVRSSGLIDKGTVLCGLIGSIYYSNMEFDQLMKVRQDGIVDESVVFRAVWQRQALVSGQTCQVLDRPRFRFRSKVLVGSGGVWYSDSKVFLGLTYRLRLEVELEAAGFVCRFELQRELTSVTPRIQYSVYCLNPHRLLMDRSEVGALAPVTVQRELEDGQTLGFVGRVLLDFEHDLPFTLYTTVALEISGFQHLSD